MREGGLLCMMAIRHIIVVLFFIEQDLLEMKIKHKLDLESIRSSLGMDFEKEWIFN